jgi:tetratricopeptide (TPR) repeat protein
MELYRKAVEVASRDTAYNDIKRQSLIYLGNIAADSAEGAADAAAKRPYIQAARGAFEEILKDPNAGELRANAQSGMCRVAIASGDTVVLRSMYKDQLSSPGGFGYNDLMNAGVCMARAEMVTEATTLFQSALEKNTHHRDALSNLTIMLLRKDNFNEAIPVASRLVSVEPNNQENMQLLMLSYAGIAKRARDQRAAGLKAGAAKTGAKAGATKAAPAGARPSQAVIDSLFKFETAYTDSAVKLNERREAMTLRVSLTDFTSTEEKAVMAGNIQNTGTADKNVTMKVEFLDRTGKTIATKDVEVAVPAGKSARFNATVTPGNKEITAFKYHPIS